MIELLITMLIISIVTSIVVVRHGSFNNSVLLRNQAYEIGLTLREAQVYTLSDRGEAGVFRQNYGVHFVKNSQEVIIYLEGTHGGDDEQYAYNAADDTVLDTLRMDSRFVISEIVYKNNSAADEVDANFASVSFARPDFDAKINPEGGGSITNKEHLRVTIQSLDNSSFTRSILITAPGRISIE